jgi:hypothetical protein
VKKTLLNRSLPATTLPSVKVSEMNAALALNE